MDYSRHFRLVAHVTLNRRVPWQASTAEQPVVAYYRTYYVTAASEAEALSIVEAEIKDGDLDSRRSTVEEVEPESLPPKVARHFRPPPKGRFWRMESFRGIWYRSGRGFHA